jgi:hypothetical protein
VGNDADSHELLAVVAAVHHEGVGEALNDGALGLPEALDGIAASGVGDVDRGADLDVIAMKTVVSHWLLPESQRSSSQGNAQRAYLEGKGAIREGDVPDLNILVAPLVEQLDAANLVGHLLGEDGITGGALDFDFAVRHDCDC